MAENTTYLFQEQPRHKVFRIQTTDSSVAKKMRRRKSSMLVGKGINTSLWIFRVKYSTREKAKLSLQRITGQKISESGSMGEFEYQTVPILIP